MVLMVRDEADIIEDNLRYHRAQGVDFFVVGDNGSTDGTVEILERHERAGILRLERIEGDWQGVQTGGQTRIARIAGEMGADWVIHNDADEFWWPLAGNLKQALAEVPDRFGMVLAPRTEFVARPDGPGTFAERLTVREVGFRRPPRTAHRPHPQVTLWTSHPIDVWVDRGGTPREGLVGKPAMRQQARHVEETELDLVLAPRFPVGIYHFPLRSFEQYRRKIEVAAINKWFRHDAESRAVEEAYEAGRLDEVYRRLALDDAQVQAGIGDGWLTEDTRFRDYLRACPEDPGTEAPPPQPDIPADERAQDLAELEADAMYALSRYLQTAAYKKQTGRRRQAAQRSRERRLRRQVRRLRRRARRIESSLWWRLRPRLPRRGSD
jgi:hypothetical protein